MLAGARGPNLKDGNHVPTGRHARSVCQSAGLRLLARTYAKPKSPAGRKEGLERTRFAVAEPNTPAHHRIGPLP